VRGNLRFHNLVIPGCRKTLQAYVEWSVGGDRGVEGWNGRVRRICAGEVGGGVCGVMVVLQSRLL
jgi:hypothetical protein